MRGIREQVDRARGIYASWGRAIGSDKELSCLVERYRRAIGRTRKIMATSGMVAACTRCALKTPGGCCFQDVETWYDPVLLLMNLLMGCDMPARREIAAGCFFLGEKGCKLLARYSFCINYLCPHLKALLGPSGTGRFVRVAGQELLRGSELELALVRWLSKAGVKIHV